MVRPGPGASGPGLFRAHGEPVALTVPISTVGRVRDLTFCASRSHGLAYHEAMELLGVHHISVNVADNAAAERFYVEVLGFAKLPRPDFGFPGTWLGLPDGRQVHLIEVENWEAPKGQHFALHVAELDAVRDELMERGIKVSKVSEIAGVGRQCFFKDPCGNSIELNEPITSRRSRPVMAAATV